ncbi:FixH family protein [Bacillus sp. A301a_S52]|nr:FixH family protein [Bacillus sp. A301a_S52]
MKRVMTSLVVIGLAGLITACGQGEPDNSSGAVNVNDVNLEPLEAEINIPETAELGEEVVLQTLVLQGDEKVDDASEVIFEVWLDGEKADSDMIEADLPGEEGIYEVTYEFSQNGVYMVQPHVTARGSHVMPVEEITVGQTTEENEEGNNSAENDDHHDHEGDSHERGHLHESMTLDWRAEEEAHVGDEVTLTAYVEWEEEAWSDGEVQYEIWKHGDERHEWIPAEEVEAGLYEAVHVFEDEGEYHVMVHLEDNSVHEHVQYLIQVN